MKNLIESINKTDYLAAKQIIESRLADIAEQKIFERKVLVAEKTWVANSKDDWAKYRKQNPSLAPDQDSKGNTIKTNTTSHNMANGMSKQDIARRKMKGYVKAADALKSPGGVDGFDNSTTNSSSVDGVDKHFAKVKKSQGAGTRFGTHLGKALGSSISGKDASGKSVSRLHSAKRAYQLVSKSKFGKAVKGTASFINSALSQAATGE